MSFSPGRFLVALPLGSKEAEYEGREKIGRNLLGKEHPVIAHFKVIVSWY